MSVCKPVSHVCVREDHYSPLKDSVLHCPVHKQELKRCSWQTLWMLIYWLLFLKRKKLDDLPMVLETWRFFCTYSSSWGLSKCTLCILCNVNYSVIPKNVINLGQWLPVLMCWLGLEGCMVPWHTGGCTAPCGWMTPVRAKNWLMEEQRSTIWVGSRDQLFSSACLMLSLNPTGPIQEQTINVCFADYQTFLIKLCSITTIKNHSSILIFYSTMRKNMQCHV